MSRTFIVRAAPGGVSLSPYSITPTTKTPLRWLAAGVVPPVCVWWSLAPSSWPCAVHLGGSFYLPLNSLLFFHDTRNVSLYFTPSLFTCQHYFNHVLDSDL
ncbi:hypothetical protein M8J75_011288 [Diaphorina citri]|nr:hypothetical protein M8J75_011288 [Diaphorina citri]